MKYGFIRSLFPNILLRIQGINRMPGLIIMTMENIIYNELPARGFIDKEEVIC